MQGSCGQLQAIVAAFPITGADGGCTDYAGGEAGIVLTSSTVSIGFPGA
jgi:hypothetical protein